MLINLLAASNTTQESSASKSSSASIGLAISTQGVGVTASASKATGQGAGNGTTCTNTQVEGGQQVTIQSGSDTTLKGATVTGNQVTANVGGNLTIESLQDQSQYNESSKSASGSVMVGVTGTGPAGGNVNLGQSRINSQFASVNEQSAIRAGDGGFNVNVQGKTELTGGQITSTQAAIDHNKNSFSSAGGTTTTDLQNRASYEAKSVSVGLGTGTPSPGAALSAGLSGVGVGSDKGSASSVTTAGITGVAGKQQARTGDKETGLVPIFDKDKARAEVNAQMAITSEFGKQASKAVGDYAQKQYDQALAAGDKAGIEAWKEGGANRVALHTVVGGLTGGVQGAVGAGAASAAAPAIDQLQGQLQEGLQKAGLGESASKVIAGLASGATAAGIGAAASGGSTAGAATAFNADMNNRQIGAQERNLAKRLSDKAKASGLTKADGTAYTQADIENAMRNSGKGNEPVTTGMLADPNNPKAITDKGASFTSNDGKTLVQVNKDGSNLNPASIDPKLAAYIVQETGGANTPYKDLLNQLEAAKKGPGVDPNASIKMQLSPGWNAGANSAGLSSNLPTDTRTQSEVDKSLNDTTKAIILAPYAAGAAVASPAAAAIGAGVNLGAQIIKGEGVSPTEVMTSTIMGPLGTAVTEATAVKAIVEAGGPAAIATKAGIGAGTNVTSDSGAKVIKGEDVTSGDVLKAGVSGAVGALPKSQVMQNVITEGVNALIDGATKTASDK